MSHVDSTPSDKSGGNKATNGAGGTQAVSYVTDVKKVIGMPARHTPQQRTAILLQNVALRSQRRAEAMQREQDRQEQGRERAAQQQRDQRKDEAKNGANLIDVVKTKCSGAKHEDVFEGALANSSAEILKSAASKSGMVSVSEDATLKAVVNGLAEVQELIAKRQFGEANDRLKALKEQHDTGRSTEEEKRKKAMLPDNKRIHQERVAQYDKLKTLIEGATAHVADVMLTLDATNNELCSAVHKMLTAIGNGKLDAANPWHVKNLRDFLKAGGLPTKSAATSEKLLDKATTLLDQLVQNRLQGDTSPEKVANVLLDLGASGRGTSGTSEVQIVKHPEGTVAFAFKPLDGESVQNKGDTLREVVSSRMCQSFTALTNPKIDLGFPDVNAAKVGGRSGVLIEGLNGTELPAEKKEKFSDQQRDKLDEMAASVPPQELQKVLLSAMVCGDGDIKWDNVFLVGDGKQARRFDGGKGLPDKDGRHEIFLEETGGGSKILTSEDCLLFNTPFSKQPLSAANAPMSQELVDSFISIKKHLKDLKDTMVQESQAACKALSTKQVPQSLDASAIEQTVRSIGRAVEILENNSPITMKDFYKAWAAQRVLDMASDYLADLQPNINAFTNLDQRTLTQSLKQIGLDNDLAARVQEIQRIIAAGPNNYDDSLASDIHTHFLRIDILLAALEYLEFDPTSDWIVEFQKKCKVIPPEDETGKTIAVDAHAKQVWSELRKLNKDEFRKLIAKVAKFTGPHGGRCARPGASMTLRFNLAQPDRDPNSCVFVGLVRHVLTVYLVNGALPPNLLGQIKAKIA